MTPIQSITDWHSLPLTSHTCIPIGSPYGSLSQREKYRLNTFRLIINERVRSRLFAGGTLPVIEKAITSIPVLVPFWPKPISLFGLLHVTTFIDGSHMLTIPSTLAPDRIETNSRYHPLTIQITSNIC